MNAPASRALTAGEVADLVGAVCEGERAVLLTGVAALADAEPHHLTFCTGPRWRPVLAQTRAGAVLIDEGDPPPGVVALRVSSPRGAYARAAALLAPSPWPAPGVHPRAYVDPTAIVHSGATIEALAVIEAGATVAAGAWVMAHAYVGRQAQIGEHARLFPHAVVLERCTIGPRATLHPGAVIGADGFGHVLGPDGVVRVPQLGVAVIEADVEVGANACVDRAALGETRVGQGSKLDNLVQIAHGVQVGAECLLAAFAGVAGGARLGRRVIMGGRTAVIDGIEVGDGAVFAGLASASRDVPAGVRLGGSPARRYSQWLREVASIAHLPGALRRLDRLERALREGGTNEPRRD